MFTIKQMLPLGRRDGLAWLLTFFVAAGLLVSTPGLAAATDHGQPLTATGDARRTVEVEESSHTVPIAASLPRPAELPPLPFRTPQVGPVIKRAFGDDIERRTTAFIPTALDDLTPIKMPVGEKKWIRVDLSEQIVVAYEGNTPIRAFVVSTGLSGTPTVQGEFRIKMKVRSQTMSGGQGAYYYNLPNVQWVQYFYSEYAFHGTYWHNDFGRPKSHGCVNMTNADAKWLFDWAGPEWDGRTTWYRSSEENPGTLVIVHE